MDLDDTDFDFTDSCVKIDFSTWKRCRVVSKQNVSKFLRLNVVLCNYEQNDDILLGFPWSQMAIRVNDIISVIAIYDESKQCFVVSNDSGLLVVNPDYLISSTKVAQSLFCQRKAVLSEKFQIDSAGSLNMIVGVLIHELFQKALFSILIKKDKPDVKKMYLDAIKSRDFAFKCYEHFLCIDMVEKPLQDYLMKIEEFLKTNIIRNPLQENQNLNKDQTCIQIDKIHDIEENVWSPQLGLKGKVDVTVHLHGRKAKSVTPFELKTGRASMEHRAQIILYITMMKQMNCVIDSGLLYYLQDNALTEITENQNEVRDLIISRNELVNHLSNYETEVSSSTECQDYNLMKLPEPIRRESVCKKCGYNLVCALHHNNSVENDATNPIQDIGEQILRHLSNEDLKYFFKWTEILLKEEQCISESENSNEIWTKSPQQRYECGRSIIDLTLKHVTENLDGSLMHTFIPAPSLPIDHINFEIGQYVVISTLQRVAITAGIVTYYKEDCIQVSIDRNLEMQYPKDKFIIDQYSSRNLLNFSYGNLALLMQDTPPANHLRNIIVKKIPMEYSEDLVPIIPETVVLNEIQYKAVGNSLTCSNYLLIKGYAGTGKTETIAAIINSYHQQNKSVLITSHTHSAVDNILLRLRALGLKFLRVGKMNRLKPEIQEFSEVVITKDCKSPSDFESTYAKFSIIGVTCYGTTHPLFSRRMFDVCIVDEATQVTQPVILRSLLCAKKFILVGDPFQLPPVMMSNEAKSLGGDESLFCYLATLDQSLGLQIQYRMNAQIAYLANRFTYNNRMIFTIMYKKYEDYSKEVVQYNWESRIFKMVPVNAVLFIDTGPAYERNIHLMKNEMFSVHIAKMIKTGNNLNSSKKLYLNMLEAILVIHMVEKFLRCKIPINDIGVIVSYRSQADCLKILTKKKKQFENLEINTVDQYQGRDKELIIYSCTKTNRSRVDTVKTHSAPEILDDQRRLNVAITRAKEKLMIIGDYSSIKENIPFKKLVNCMPGNIVRIPDSFYETEWTNLLRELQEKSGI